VPLYDAFTSYSHAKDKPIAAALQLAVQIVPCPTPGARRLHKFAHPGVSLSHSLGR